MYNMQHSVKYIDLFAGIGGFHQAMNSYNGECVFASEWDIEAAKTYYSNYNIKPAGDITKIDAKDIPKHDLLCAGFPCQAFSISGKQKGFEDTRGTLFFDIARIVDFHQPKALLLENVRMKKEYQDIISEYLGVDPIIINSNLVSAQNRTRYYWTNIPNIEQPRDKGLLLKDVTEDGLQSLGLAQRGRYDENGKVIQKYELNGTEKSNAMTTVSKDTLLFIPVDKHSSNSGLVCLGGVMKSTHKLWLDNGKLLQRNFSQGNRVYSNEGKSATLNANSGGIGGKTGLYEIEGVIRKLTRLECERLQTVPDGYTSAVSDTQAIKMLGNGWTVDVIAHIFKGLLDENL